MADGRRPSARGRASRLLQRWVLFTNRVPWLLRLNQVPYQAAVAALVRRLKRHPEVAALYVRNSYGQGHWMPGSSDIDLTLVVEDGLRADEEFDFCEAFDRQYASLRRVFPMLGEVEVLQRSHVDARIGVSITGYESQHWRRLYGRDVLTPRYLPDDARLARDRLSHAVAIYHYLLMPWIATARLRDLTSRLVVKRMVLKILRYLHVDAGPAERRILEHGDPFDGLLVALDHLSGKARVHASGTPADERLDLRVLFDGAPHDLVRREALPHGSLLSGADHSALESIVAMADSPLRTHVLLRSDLDAGRRRNAAAAACGTFGNPVVTERHVFAHFLSHVNPIEHALLRRERIVPYGDDPLPLPDQPGRRSFPAAIALYAVDMFPYPYSVSLRTSSDEVFRNLLFGWLLRTLRYLEDGIVEFDFDKLRSYFEREHPEYRQAAGSLDSPGSPRARFALVKLVVGDLSRQLLRRSRNGSAAGSGG